MTIGRRDLLEQDEFWILLFTLGFFLLNWPLLSLVAGENHVLLGFPLILVYVIVVWLMIILWAYLFERWSAE